MIFTSEALISELIELTKQNIKSVEKLTQKPIHELNWKADAKTWSVLECIEHLNLCSDFYLPKIERGIDGSTSTFEANYKSGVLSHYFAKSMLPKEKLNKVKTFKKVNPNGSDLTVSTLQRFLTLQEKTLLLLKKSKNINLNTIKVPSMLGKIFKLKLGDAFRVVIYHNLRHIIQAQKTLEIKANNPKH